MDDTPRAEGPAEDDRTAGELFARLLIGVYGPAFAGVVLEELAAVSPDAADGSSS